MSRDSFGILSVIIAAGWLVFLAWCTYAVVVLNRANTYAENGLIENTQVGLLVIACVVFLVSIAFDKGLDKAILLFCSWLCLAYILREVDVEDLNVPHALKLVGAGVGRNAILGTVFIALMFYAAFKFSYYRNAIAGFLASKPGVLLVIGSALVMLADVFEKQKSLPYHVYLEEMCELLAYALILLAAAASCQRSIAGNLKLR